MKRVWTAFWIALATLPGLIVLATTTSQAQFKGSRGPSTKSDEVPKKKTDDTQYKAAIERLPDKKFDPWANMR